MNTMDLMRYLLLALSGVAMVAGVLIIAGVLVPSRVTLPDHIRVVLGAVIFLYGLYRFLISYYRRSRP